MPETFSFEEAAKPKSFSFDEASGKSTFSFADALDWATAGPKAIANLGTGLVAGFPAYLAGGVTGLAKDDEDPRERGSRWSESVTYQPKGKYAEAATDVAQYPFRKLMEWSEAGGHKVTDVTGSAGAGATTEAAIQMLPALFGMGGRGRFGKSKVADEVPRETTPKPAPPPAPVSRDFPIELEPAPAPKPVAAAPKVEPKPAPAPEPFPAEKYGNLDDVLPLAPKPEPAPEPFAKPAETSTLGPSTLGANPMLDAAQVAKTGRAAKEAIDGVLRDVLGEPGENQTVFRPIRDTMKTNIKRLERWVTGEAYDIRQAFTTKEARKDLTLRIVSGDDVTGWAGLTPAQKVVANKAKADWDKLSEYSRQSGREVGYRQNYSPDIWNTADKFTKDKLDSWREMRGEPPIKPGASQAPSAGTVSPHMLPRAIELQEGLREGLKPLTLDAAELLEIYVKSMASAVERGKAYNALANLRTGDGEIVQIPHGEAPKDYVKIDNPELEGFRFHPEVAPDIKVLLESKEPGVIRSTLQTLAYGSKRALVSYSGFHPMNMFFAWLGTNPGMKAFNPKGAIDAALKTYREGAVGDRLDKLMAKGFNLTPPIEDVAGREKFKVLIDKTAKIVDKIVPGHAAAGEKAPIRLAKELDERIQRFTWPYLQTGFKIEIALRKDEQLMKKHAKAIAEGKITEDKILEQTAKFANAVEGGLDWEGMLDHFETPAARKVMSEVLSKSGRLNQQIVLFAPDWLISTLSTWTSALPVSEANAIKASLSRRYLATSAVGTFAIGSAVNYYYTGHSMFENKSRKKDATWQDDLKAKTMVDLGDGTYINPNKHYSEMLHLAAGPEDFLYNKMNPVAKEPLEFMENKQWLSRGWAPPITEKTDSPIHKAVKHLGHFAGKFVPITGRQIMEQGPGGIAGFAGFPKSGMTDEQKARAREERK